MTELDTGGDEGGVYPIARSRTAERVVRDRGLLTQEVLQLRRIRQRAKARRGSSGTPPMVITSSPRRSAPANNGGREVLAQ